MFLLSLNIAGARAKDIPIPARYGDEASTMRIHKVAPRIARLLNARLPFGQPLEVESTDEVVGDAHALEYAGSREIIVAMERNEVQGMCGMDWSSLATQQRNWISSGFVRALEGEVLDRDRLPLGPRGAQSVV